MLKIYVFCFVTIALSVGRLTPMSLSQLALDSRKGISLQKEQKPLEGFLLNKKKDVPLFQMPEIKKNLLIPVGIKQELQDKTKHLYEKTAPYRKSIKVSFYTDPTRLFKNIEKITEFEECVKELYKFEKNVSINEENQKVIEALVAKIVVQAGFIAYRERLYDLQQIYENYEYWVQQRDQQSWYFLRKSPSKWFFGPPQEEEIDKNILYLEKLQSGQYAKLGALGLHLHQFDGTFVDQKLYDWIGQCLFYINSLCETDIQNRYTIKNIQSLFNSVKHAFYQSYSSRKKIDHLLQDVKKPGHFVRNWVPYTALALSGIATYVAYRKNPDMFEPLSPTVVSERLKGLYTSFDNYILGRCRELWEVITGQENNLSGLSIDEARCELDVVNKDLDTAKAEKTNEDKIKKLENRLAELEGIIEAANMEIIFSHLKQSSDESKELCESILDDPKIINVIKGEPENLKDSLFFYFTEGSGNYLLNEGRFYKGPLSRDEIRKKIDDIVDNKKIDVFYEMIKISSLKRSSPGVGSIPQLDDAIYLRVFMYIYDIPKIISLAKYIALDIGSLSSIVQIFLKQGYKEFKALRLAITLMSIIPVWYAGTQVFKMSGKVYKMVYGKKYNSIRLYLKHIKEALISSDVEFDNASYGKLLFLLHQLKHEVMNVVPKKYNMQDEMLQDVLRLESHSLTIEQKKELVDNMRAYYPFLYEQIS